MHIKWHPKTGEHKVFEDDELAPPDWLPYHPDDTDKGGEGVEVVAPKPYTVKEVQELLTEGGVQFDSKMKLADLTTLLDQSVKAALIARGVHFDEAEPTRDLVTKLTFSLNEGEAA